MKTHHTAAPEQPPDDSTCTDTRGASKLLALSEVTLAQWRMHGKGPAFHRFGRQIRYKVGDLIAYMAARRVRGAE